MKRSTLIATVAGVLLAVAGNAQTTVSGTIDGHDYVDLGLSVKWATCNVGASSPEDYGNYYAWGETTTKSTYTTENSKTYGKEGMDDITGNPSYDAARANWGGLWRMPTQSEMEELIINCTFENIYDVEFSGYKGCKVASKINGNSIFLPAAGWRDGASSLRAGRMIAHWSSMPWENDSHSAYLLSSDHVIKANRNIGFNVRPVYGPISKNINTDDPAIYKPTGTLSGHDYVDLGLSVKWATCNVGASSPSDYGNYYAWGETTTKSTYTKENSRTYGKDMDDITGNPSYDAARANWGGSWRMPTVLEMEELVDKCTWTWTIQGSHTGYKVTSKINGNSIFVPAAGRRDELSLNDAVECGYYWGATPDEWDTQEAFFIDFSRADHLIKWNSRYYGYSVRPVYGPISKNINTDDPAIYKPTGTLSGHDYVDLGLSVKWATCNVGASSPGDYGDYFAWGETTTKSTYTEENSKIYGKDMGDISGNSAYDAARANWGGSWRMPTQKEMWALRHCRWISTTCGGHKGYRVTGRNGNSIFLPAAGLYNGSSLSYVGVGGYWWNSTPYENDMQNAYHVYFDFNRYGCTWFHRYFGLSIRPVSD